MPKRKRPSRTNDSTPASGPTNPSKTGPGERLDRYLAYRARLEEWRAELLPKVSPSDVGFLLYDMKLAPRPSAAAPALAAMNEEDRARIEDHLLFSRRGWIATPMQWRAWTSRARDDVDRALARAIGDARAALLEVVSLDSRGAIECRDVLRGEDVSLFEPPVARAMKAGVIFSAQLLPFDELTMTTGTPMAVGLRGSAATNLILSIIRDLLGFGDRQRPLTSRENRKLAFIMLRTVFAVRKSPS